MEANQALLVIDMQKEGLLNRNVFHKEQLIHNINALIDNFRKQDKPLFFIRHTNLSFLKEDTDGWQICEELNILKEDMMINKRHSDVFRETHFLSLLKEYSISNVVVTGLVSNGCIKAACLGAIKMGFSVILISDAHSTFHKDAERVISDWNLRLQEQGAELISTSDFLKNNESREKIFKV